MSLGMFEKRKKERKKRGGGGGGGGGRRKGFGIPKIGGFLRGGFMFFSIWLTCNVEISNPLDEEGDGGHFTVK